MEFTVGNWDSIEDKNDFIDSIFDDEIGGLDNTDNV